MSQIEIEFKVLLGSPEAREQFLQRAKAKFPELCKVSEESQLNHYFTGPVTDRIADAFEGKVPADRLTELRRLIREWKDFSIRTRHIAPSRNILVFKVAMSGGGSAVHGAIRAEWEEDIANIGIDELDELLLGAGLEYLSKWSRDRETYETGTGVNLCTEKTPGYGYVVEFEKVISDESQAVAWHDELRALAKELGVEELDADRLNRMFAFYNKNWRDYYRTENIFTVL